MLILSPPMCGSYAAGVYGGAVKYEVSDAFEYAFTYHRSQCRRTTGSASKPLAGYAARSAGRSGRHATMVYGVADAHDSHCQICSSLLFSVVREDAYVHVLNDEPAIRPSMHIFVGSQAAWFDIADDPPQHESFPKNQASAFHLWTPQKTQAVIREDLASSRMPPAVRPLRTRMGVRGSEPHRPSVLTKHGG